MKKKLIWFIIIGIIIGIFSISSLYCKEQSQSEKEFENIVTEFNVIMQSFNLGAKDYQKQAQELQPRAEVLINNLKAFILKYSRSKYVDDAAYILTLFWEGQLEKYIQELKLFLKEFPNASLENWTSGNLEAIVFEKEIGIINTVKFNLLQALYGLKKYEESAKEARRFIDNLDIENLTDKGHRILGLAYFILMKDYEALGNTKKIKEVCKESIEKLQDPRDKESFTKKLKELEGSLLER